MTEMHSGVTQLQEEIVEIGGLVRLVGSDKVYEATLDFGNALVELTDAMHQNKEIEKPLEDVEDKRKQLEDALGESLEPDEVKQ